jgi:hypothetical protein
MCPAAFRIYILLLASCFWEACELRGANVTSTWSSLSGFWTQPTNWTHSPTNIGADYPHDGDLTYDVIIQEGAVTLTEPVTVESFRLNGGVLVNNSELVVSTFSHLNAGTLRGTGTLAASIRIFGGNITNDSSIRVRDSDFDFEYATMHSTINSKLYLDNSSMVFYEATCSGNYVLNSNATLGFGGSNRIQHGSTIFGKGRAGAVILFLEGNVTNTCAFSQVSPRNALDGPGSLSIAGKGTLRMNRTSLLGAGGLEIGPEASAVFFDLNGGWRNRSVTNFGTCVFSNTYFSGDSWFLHNSGQLRFYSEDNIFASPVILRWNHTGTIPVIVNHGHLSFGFFTSAQLDANLTNYETVSLNLGHLSVSNFVNFGKSRLDGFVYAHHFENRSGSVWPYSLVAAVSNNAAFHFGTNYSYVSGSFSQSSNATLHLQFGGAETTTNQAALQISGEILFDGALSIEFVNGFQPTLGQRLQAISYNGARGLFRTIQGLNLGNGLRLAPIVNSNKFDLLVVNAPASNSKGLHIEQINPGAVTIISTPEFQGFFIEHATNLVRPSWERIGFSTSNMNFQIVPSIPQHFFRLSDPSKN